jgi:hypothetical protein
MELRGASLQCGRRTLPWSEVQSHQRNGSAHVPAGTHQAPGFRTLWGYYAATVEFGLKNSPVFSIVCITTASLRATATAALLKPILS